MSQILEIIQRELANHRPRIKAKLSYTVQGYWGQAVLVIKLDEYAGFYEDSLRGVVRVIGSKCVVTFESSSTTSKPVTIRLGDPGALDRIARAVLHGILNEMCLWATERGYID